MRHMIRHGLVAAGTLMALAAATGVGAQRLVAVGGAVIDSEQLAYPILEVAGGRLYGVSDDGLSVFSLDDPARPEWLGSFVFPAADPSRDGEGPARAAVRRDVVFVGAGERMLAVDCRRPATPVLRVEWSVLGGRVVGLAAHERFLWVASAPVSGDGYTLTTFDITDPGHPYPVARQSFAADARGLSLIGDVLVVHHQGSFSTLDLGRRTVPSPAGPFAYEELPVHIGGLANGRRLLVHPASRTERRVVDLTNPARPFVAGVLSAPELDYDERGDWLIDDGLYLESGLFHVTVWDLERLSATRFLGAVRQANWSRAGLARAGDLLYVAGGHSLETWRLTRPTHPRVVADVRVEGDIIRMTVDDHTAYLAADRAGLATVDLTDPTEPSPLGRLPVEGAVRGVDVAEGVAALAVGRGSYGLESGVLVLVDVSDPADPHELGVLEIPETICAEDVAIAGDVAWLVGYPAVLTAVDISDPTEPHVVGQYVETGEHEIDRDDLGLVTWMLADLEVEGDRAAVWPLSGYLPNDFPEVLIFDISDPSNPTSVGTELGLGPHRALALQDGKLFHGSMVYLPQFPPSLYWTRTGFWSLVVSDPLSGTHLGSAATWGSGCVGVECAPDRRGFEYQPISIALDGGRAYLGHQDGMLATVDISDPAKPRCLALTALPGTPAGLEMVDGYLVAGLWKEGLAVLDVGDRPDWRGLSTQPAGSFAHELVVRDDVAYLANDWGGLMTVDVSQPDAPHILARVPFTYDVERVALEGTNALLDWGSYDELGMVDVADPANPEVHGTASFDFELPYREELHAADGDVLLLSRYSLEQLTRGDGNDYETEWHFTGWPDDPRFEHCCFEPGGARLFVLQTDGDWNDPEYSLSVMDRRTGSVLAWTPLRPDARCVAGAEATVFLGRGKPELEVYEVPPDHVPQRAGAVGLGEPPVELVAAGEVVYAVGATTLTAVDVADPARPRVLDTVTHGLSPVDAWHDDATHTVWITDGMLLAAFELQYPRPKRAKGRDLSPASGGSSR